MSNIATLLPPNVKGQPRRGGRAKGTLNRTTRALKIAVINAAEKSVHCPPDNKTLEGYCLYLANEHPTTFANLLARLIPVQAKIKTEANVQYEPLNMNMSLPEMIARFEAK